MPYLLFGVAMGWAAWRTGSVWMAFAFHFTNNLLGVSLIGYRGDVVPTVAPLTRDFSTLPMFSLIGVDLIVLVIQIVLVEVVVRRRGVHRVSGAGRLTATA